jgi:hypothetical protein
MVRLQLGLPNVLCLGAWGLLCGHRKQSECTPGALYILTVNMISEKRVTPRAPLETFARHLLAWLSWHACMHDRRSRSDISIMPFTGHASINDIANLWFWHFTCYRWLLIFTAMGNSLGKFRF